MTLHFNPNSKSGFTLFEALISLSILSLILAVAATQFSGPSDQLRFQSELAALREDIMQTRASAIQNSTAKMFNAHEHLCAIDRDTQETTITFFADGSAIGPDLCIDDHRLQLDPITGLFLRSSGHE